MKRVFVWVCTCVLLLAADVYAAPASVPVGTIVPGNADAIPFSAASGSPSPSRYQQVYSQSAFSGAIDITDVAFFLDSSYPSLSSEKRLASGTYNLYLFTTPTGVSTMSATFADNQGTLPPGPLTPFATLTLSGQVAPLALTFSGVTPYHYDPSMGNLLVDIGVSGFNQADSSKWAYFYRNTGSLQFSTTHNFITYGPGAGEAYLGQGLVTEFKGEVSAVPVPGALLLVGIGSGLVGWVRRRS